MTSNLSDTVANGLGLRKGRSVDGPVALRDVHLSGARPPASRLRDGCRAGLHRCEPGARSPDQTGEQRKAYFYRDVPNLRKPFLSSVVQCRGQLGTRVS